MSERIRGTPGAASRSGRGVLAMWQWTHPITSSASNGRLPEISS